MTDPVLVVEDAAVDYGGVQAVRGVSLQVAAGRSVAVLGANGAGKTSLLRAISGLEALAGGRVWVGGQDVTGLAPERIARMGVAHVPDDRGIFDELTVADNLRTATFGAGLGGREAAQAVDEVCELFPILHERWTQQAGTLSGGQQQMLTIGRALSQRPRLLMVDEMSMGLAPSIVADLFDVVGSLTDRGIAVLLVEQFVGQALAVVDHAVVMAGGRVVADGAADQIVADDVARHYLGGSQGTGEGDRQPPVHLPPSETVAVPLDARQLRALQARASREGRDPSELVAQLVQAHLPTGEESR